MTLSERVRRDLCYLLSLFSLLFDGNSGKFTTLQEIITILFPWNWNIEICSNWIFNISEVQKKSYYHWLLMRVWILSECKVLVFKRVFEIFLKYCLINLGWDWGCVIKIRWEGILGWRKLDFHKTTKIRLLNQWMLFIFINCSLLMSIISFHFLII